MYLGKHEFETEIKPLLFYKLLSFDIFKTALEIMYDLVDPFVNSFSLCKLSCLVNTPIVMTISC